MTDDELKDEIEELANRRHEESEGVGSIRVRLIQQLLTQTLDRSVSRNEVEVACDELVDEGRLEFLYDEGRSGRRYCSKQVTDEQIQRIRSAHQ